MSSLFIMSFANSWSHRTQLLNWLYSINATVMGSKKADGCEEVDEHEGEGEKDMEAVEDDAKEGEGAPAEDEAESGS